MCLLALLTSSNALVFRFVGVSRVGKRVTHVPVLRSLSGISLAMVERGSGSGDEFDSSEMAAMSSSELRSTGLSSRAKRRSMSRHESQIS